MPVNARGSRWPAGRRRAAPSLALVLVFSMAALSNGAVGARGQYISAADVAPVDLDGDGLFDLLNVSVEVQAPMDGSYTVQVTLAWPEPSTPTVIASRTDSFVLDTAPRHVVLPLDGPRIREAGLDGPYEVQVRLTSSVAGGVSDAATFPTPALRASDFEEGPATGRPRFLWQEDAASLSSDALVATVNLTGARIVWSTAPGAPRAGLFGLAVPSVVSFDDDGDGAFGPGETVRCSAEVGATPWRLEALNLSATAQFGAMVALRLAGPVQFGGPNCPTGPSGNVSLSLLLAQRNGTVEGPSPYTLAGGLQVEVALAVTIDGPLPGDALAVELVAEDLEANTSFRMRGPAGFETVAPANGSAEWQPFGLAAPETPEVAAFVDAQGALRGSFGWVPVASQRLDQGQERFVLVSPSRSFSGNSMALFLAVPTDAGVSSFAVHALVGVPQPATLPQGGPDGGVEPPTEQPSLTIFVSALIAVAAMFFFSVYARAKRY